MFCENGEEVKGGRKQVKKEPKRVKPNSLGSAQRDVSDHPTLRTFPACSRRKINSFKNLRHFRDRGGIEFKETGNDFFDFFAAHRIDI